MYLENRTITIDKICFLAKSIEYNFQLCSLTITAEFNNEVEYAIQRAQLIKLSVKGDDATFTIFCDYFDIR